MPFLATLHGLVSPRQPSLLNSLASVQLSNLRHCWRCTHTRGPARYWSIKLQLAVGSKRLPDHLVHVIITIGGEAPDEDHLRLCRGQGFIALVQRLVLRRSEEHTSELQSLMRISYAVFFLKKKNKTQTPLRYHLT